MRRTEEQHNTPEQVAEIIGTAARLVVEAELTDDLQAIAFTKAIDLLASKQIFFEQAQPVAFDPRLLGRIGH